MTHSVELLRDFVATQRGRSASSRRIFLIYELCSKGAPLPH
jgi:hypothetical protein